MEHSFPSSRYIPVPKIDKKSIQNTHNTHTKKNSRSIDRKKVFSAQKNTRKKQQKKIILMSKSDALATKEMPFRVYMGYDSHEDITFEVRATRCSSSSSIRRTTSSVFVASRIVYCACVLDDKIMIFGRRTRDVERCVCLSLG